MEKLPLPKKPRQEQPSDNPPTTSVTKTADSVDSSYISTTKSKHKRSKRKSGPTSSKTTSTTSSGLPSDFFDSGVSKRFRGHGEEVYYESSSDSEDERSEEASGKGQLAPPPPGVPLGMFVPQSQQYTLITPTCIYMNAYLMECCLCYVLLTYNVITSMVETNDIHVNVELIS